MSYSVLKGLTFLEKIMPYCLLVIALGCLLLADGDPLLAMSFVLVGGIVWLIISLMISKAITKLSTKQLELDFGGINNDHA